jgi:hypothetical protein
MSVMHLNSEVYLRRLGLKECAFGEIRLEVISGSIKGDGFMVIELTSNLNGTICSGRYFLLLLKSYRRWWS